MKKYKGLNKVLYGIVISTLCMIFTVKASSTVRVDLASYLGQTEVSMQQSLKANGINQEIEYQLNDQDQVISITVENKVYTIDGISVGDTIDKIYRKYEFQVIREIDSGIWVGVGKQTHFGVIPQYRQFLIDEKNKIQAMTIGYTMPFMQELLPTSNQEAHKQLQGIWKSENGRILSFCDTQFQDTQLNHLWDKQEYTVIRPNELMITRWKPSHREKIRIKFSLYKNTLSVFAINEWGEPIKESLEIFSRQND